MAVLTRQVPMARAPGSPKPFSKKSSGGCVVEALTARGIGRRYLSPQEVTNPPLKGKTILAFEIKRVPFYFDGGSLRVSDPRPDKVPGPLIDGQTALLVKRKDLLKLFLRRHGISVPHGAAFPRDALKEAESCFTKLSASCSDGVCVKPVRGKKGRDVHVGLSDLASFRAAFAAVSKTHERILVEETVPGGVYRFMCLDGRMIAILSNASNLHRGCEFTDATDAVHQSYVESVERAVKFIPDLVLCGADVVIENAGVPATDGNYHVLGLNRGPSLAPHHYPRRGQPRDVAGAIVDYLASRGSSRSRGASKRRSGFSEGSSGQCLIETLAARGIDYEYLAPDRINNPAVANQTVIAFRINNDIYYFDNIRLCVPDPDGAMVPGPAIDGETATFVRQKDLVTAFLRERGFSAPKGAAFPRDAQPEAEAFFTELLPSLPNGACVKPTDSRKGRQVHVGIRDLASFRTAFAAAGKNHARILVEETVSGIAYRFLYLAGRVIAVELCRPASVEGDGIHSIADLVMLKNVERRLNPSHARRLLKLGRRERSFLERSGLEPDGVPKAGELVFLTSASNMHQGGDIIDATESVHSSYVELVERAVNLIPGLVFCGADVAIRDANAPAADDNHHFIELNCGPGFAAHHHPWSGQPRDIAGSLIDYLTGLSPDKAASRRVS